MGEYAQEQYRRFKAYLDKMPSSHVAGESSYSDPHDGAVGWKLLNLLGDWVQRRRCRREFRRAKEEARS